MTMNNEKIKKILDGLDIPEPGEEAREKALLVATSEFRNQKEETRKKIKGFSWPGRLTEKKQKGDYAMPRPMIITAGVAVALIAFVVVLSPQFVSYRQGSITPVEDIATTQKNETKIVKSDDSGTLTTTKDMTSEATESLKAGSKPQNNNIAFPSPPLAAKRLPAKTRLARMQLAEKRGFLSQEPDSQRIQNQTYIGRDQFENITPNPVKLVSEEPVSTFSIDVDTSSYAFVRRALNNGHLPQKDAVRIEELINYFDYDYPLPQERSVPFKPSISLFPTPWNPDTKLLHIGIKGFDIIPENKPRANLVFLIDVSGSMNSQDKLPLLKNSFRMLVDNLDVNDTVSIVVYAGAAGTVLEPTKIKDKAKIHAALEKLKAGGSTAGGEGIRLAYSLAEANFDPDGVNRVILATDGDFNVGIRDPEALKGFVERKQQSNIYLSILGFGQGNYNDALMQKLAQNGNGNAAYIDNLNEARKVLVDEASGTLFPIAKDVKIQVEFNPAMVTEYRLIGYETRLLRREDFNNDKIDAGDIGAGHSVTAIYEITPKGSSAQLIDNLRYGSPETQAIIKDKDKSMEYAFLKIRYKLPDEITSRLITTPIDSSFEFNQISHTSTDTRFAVAVAAFGQLLRDGSYMKQFGYDDVIDLARSARGEDRFGYRAEFINLVRLAKTAVAMGDR